jgi:hypothetical protein
LISRQSPDIVSTEYGRHRSDGSIFAYAPQWRRLAFEGTGMFFRFILTAFLAVFVAVFAPSASAQQVGTASTVVQGAEIRSATGRARLVAGSALAMGDVVTTDAQGQAQLLFADGTKIVVGPGSRLVIDQILMQGNGTAQTFAVSAVGGTFRFITGKSAKPAYKILTPTATLGLRGTEFDFAVSPRRGTNVVLFRGRVLLCAQGGNCAEVRGRCTLAAATIQGRVGAAETPDEKVATIDEEFPFVIDQSTLARAFQANTDRCNDVVQKVLTVRKARAVPALAPAPILDRRDPATPSTRDPEPAAEPTPEPEPEPEPEAAPEPEPAPTPSVPDEPPPTP